MGALIYSLVDADGFLSSTVKINDFILDHFGWLFSAGTALMLGSCIFILFHPLGRVRIGGKDAVPFLTRWRWFSIVLCTTIATGIIFWGTAEPLFHLSGPPSFLHQARNSAGAAKDAMGFMFLHWTFTPYAIYTVPALMFALAFYNSNKSFSLNSTLFPLQGTRPSQRFAALIDGVCLYALVAGMSASLGAGILTLTGGIKNLTGIESEWLEFLITALIVATFILSAISGLMKGIRILSDINARIFIILAIFVLVFGPTVAIFKYTFVGLQSYITQLPSMSLVSILHPDDPWPKSWTTFYWANWLAWAPISALFLGRLAYGYTVRDFLLFTWILPSLFGLVWMSIFGGTVLEFELAQKLGLAEALAALGPESVIYKVFEELPLRYIIAPLFLLTAFLSYVTAADSNTEAMGGISSTGISPEDPSPPVVIKVAWGVTIGAVAFIMINRAGIDGIKMLSNLGGLPSLFLIIAINIGLLYLMISKKYKQL
ncbi:MAG: choline-glycine betaine transporter [Cyclobacteriaceae bacterium]|jgi:choline-glycine betaine transporter